MRQLMNWYCATNHFSDTFRCCFGWFYSQKNVPTNLILFSDTNALHPFELLQFTINDAKPIKRINQLQREHFNTE